MMRGPSKDTHRVYRSIKMSFPQMKFHGQVDYSYQTLRTVKDTMLLFKQLYTLHLLSVQIELENHPDSFKRRNISNICP